MRGKRLKRWLLPWMIVLPLFGCSRDEVVPLTGAELKERFTALSTDLDRLQQEHQAQEARIVEVRQKLNGLRNEMLPGQPAPAARVVPVTVTAPAVDPAGKRAPAQQSVRGSEGSRFLRNIAILCFTAFLIVQIGKIYQKRKRSPSGPPPGEEKGSVIFSSRTPSDTAAAGGGPVSERPSSASAEDAGPRSSGESALKYGVYRPSATAAVSDPIVTMTPPRDAAPEAGPNAAPGQASSLGEPFRRSAGTDAVADAAADTFEDDTTRDASPSSVYGVDPSLSPPPATETAHTADPGRDDIASLPPAAYQGEDPDEPPLSGLQPGSTSFYGTPGSPPSAGDTPPANPTTPHRKPKRRGRG